MGIGKVVFPSCATMWDHMYLTIQDFLAKELSVPFHMDHIIPDLLPGIFPDFHN